MRSSGIQFSSAPPLPFRQTGIHNFVRPEAAVSGAFGGDLPTGRGRETYQYKISGPILRPSPSARFPSRRMPADPDHCCGYSTLGA